MTPAIALLVIGAILIKSGWKNQNILDVALGRDSKRSGGNVPEGDGSHGSDGSPSIPTAPGIAGPGSHTIGGGVSRMLGEMNRIAGLNLPYLWGGGHLNYPHEGPFDCSGAVSYVLHAAGLMHGPPRISTTFMAYGSAGRGRTFTIYANPTHVFIRDETTGRDWGTTKTVGRGGPRWHHHTTTGFVARCHPDDKR